MNTWINGRPGVWIDCSDRGLLYGDGVFETMRVRRRRVRLLDYHVERLIEGCRRLKIRAPSVTLLRREIREHAGLRAEGVLKLVLTRGSGQRGYRPGTKERCTRVLSLHALPHGPARAPGKPVRVRVCATPVGSNPRFAGLKTLNRLESVIARAEWRDERVWEGLMLDLDRNVICGTMSNVFLRRGSSLITPALDRCGIAGVMRRWVLEQASALRLSVREGRVSLEAIGDAEEVFMTNAVAGIVTVASIGRGKRRISLQQSSTADLLRARLEAL